MRAGPEGPALFRGVHFAIEQCPPEAACPEPAAISGGSSARSRAGERDQSQARKAARTDQNSSARSAGEEKAVMLMVRVCDPGSAGAVQKPKRRRTRMPTSVPAKARGTQIQPCRLPVEMPLSMAPTLQPKARREL